MNRYVYASLFSLAGFAAQLALTAQAQLASIDAKSEALAVKAFSHGYASAALIAIIVGYFVLGAIAHLLPMLFATKVHADLERKSHPRVHEIASRRGMQTLALAVTLLLMALCNQRLFPASTAFPNIDLLFSQAASPLLVYGLPALICGIVMYWMAIAASRRARVGVTALAVVLVAGWQAPLSLPHQDSEPRAQPDVIVIGVDSLRPDHLNTYGFPGKPIAPVIDQFVAGSRRFDQAYTTQGRTFVAYMSILSGLYPTHHGARENLYPANLYRKDASIAHRFAKSGYTTALAMDEARFANFDRGFGFDEVISPPPGVADFLIGTFLDTVGTNLLQFLPYSDYFMPHVAGNRAASSVYRPAAFDNKIARAIRSADERKPLFLVSHYCIAHIPYVAVKEPMPALPVPYQDSSPTYRAAIAVADGQVSTLLSHLRAAGRLDNAVVVLLSDHGESLGMAKDLWHNSTGTGNFTAFTRGHGSMALDESESRVLLSIQRYINGKAALTPAASQTAVGLVDVAPTLLTMAGVGYEAHDFDGLRLLDRDGRFAALPTRALFVESGISGVSLQKTKVDPGEVATEFSYLYRITPALRFELQPSELPEQLRRKQRVMLLGRYGLSSWPSRARPDEVGNWIRLDRLTKVAESLPLDTADFVVQAYKPLLCAHFATDAEFRKHWCGQAKAHSLSPAGPLATAAPEDATLTLPAKLESSSKIPVKPLVLQ